MVNKWRKYNKKSEFDKILGESLLMSSDKDMIPNTIMPICVSLCIHTFRWLYEHTKLGYKNRAGTTNTRPALSTTYKMNIGLDGLVHQS